jgi:hypothetical protein
MRPSVLKDTIKAWYTAGIDRVLYVEGMPGIGKTQIPRQAAAELGAAFHCIHAPTMLLEDFGMPIVNGDKSGVRFVVPMEKFPFEGSAFPPEGILLVDEAAQCATAEQKIFANLFQEREHHGYRLMAGWRIIATGNRTQDRAGANRLLSHLANRINRVSLDMTTEDWTDWAMKNGIDMDVVMFARFKPELLADFDPNRDVNPTPRAWAEGVSPLLGAMPREALTELIAGAVGEGPATEFMAFVRLKDELPDPHDVIAHPDKYDVPRKLDVRFALIGALVRHTTEKNFEQAMKFVVKYPPEFQVLYMKDMARLNPTLLNSKTFRDFALTNSGLFAG